LGAAPQSFAASVAEHNWGWRHDPPIPQRKPSQSKKLPQTSPARFSFTAPRFVRVNTGMESESCLDRPSNGHGGIPPLSPSRRGRHLPRWGMPRPARRKPAGERSGGRRRQRHNHHATADHGLDQGEHEKKLCHRKATILFLVALGTPSCRRRPLNRNLREFTLPANFGPTDDGCGARRVAKPHQSIGRESKHARESSGFLTFSRCPDRPD
jgi:hypothetical protein